MEKQNPDGEPLTIEECREAMALLDRLGGWDFSGDPLKDKAAVGRTWTCFMYMIEILKCEAEHKAKVREGMLQH